MKILIVSQHFYPETFRINDIAFSLSKMGHHVTVLTGLPNYPSGYIPEAYQHFKKRDEIIEDVRVLRTSIFARKTSLFNMALNYVSFGINASVKALFIKEKFDIVYSFQTSPISMVLPAIVMKHKQRIPLVVHCLDQWPISVTTGPIQSNSILYKTLFHFSRMIYNQADLITLSSKSFRDYFSDVLNINESKGLVYWPAYAEDIYQNITQIKNDVFDLVFAGNIGPAQNVEFIIQAAERLRNEKDLHFHIVGGGLSLEKCQSMVKELQLTNITFHGHHSVESMPEFYQLADAFLITMVDNPVVNQTLPAKIQSYLRAGKPIIGAINGEVKHVILEADCGLVCDSNDLDSFVNHIRIAKANDRLLEEWSIRASDYYLKHFDKNKLLNQLIGYFEDLIERSSHVTH